MFSDHVIDALDTLERAHSHNHLFSFHNGHEVAALLEWLGGLEKDGEIDPVLVDHVAPGIRKAVGVLQDKDCGYGIKVGRDHHLTVKIYLYALLYEGEEDVYHELAGKFRASEKLIYTEKYTWEEDGREGGSGHYLELNWT